MFSESLVPSGPSPLWLGLALALTELKQRGNTFSLTVKEFIS